MGKSLSLHILILLISVAAHAANKKCLTEISNVADGAPKYLEDFIDKLSPSVAEEIINSDKDLKAAKGGFEEFMASAQEPNEYFQFREWLEHLVDERLAFSNVKLDQLHAESLKLDEQSKKGSLKSREEAKSKLVQVQWARTRLLKNNAELEKIIDDSNFEIKRTLH